MDIKELETWIKTDEGKEWIEVQKNRFLKIETVFYRN
jgi:hypothetical protein